MYLYVAALRGVVTIYLLKLFTYLLIVLDYLAVKLKTDWLKFARALYIIPDTRLVSITENYKDLEERARQVNKTPLVPNGQTRILFGY